jgi:hypothetical protein
VILTVISDLSLKFQLIGVIVQFESSYSILLKIATQTDMLPMAARPHTIIISQSKGWCPFPCHQKGIAERHKKAIPPRNRFARLGGKLLIKCEANT